MKDANIGLLPGKKRRAGLHLHATDIDWDAGGTGDPEVTGTGEALLLAMAGRPVRSTSSTVQASRRCDRDGTRSPRRGRDR